MRITAHGWEGAIAPEDGAGMTALSFEGQEILRPAPAQAPLGGPFGAFWMIPWANRLDGGRLGVHRLPVNRPAEDTAIHGLSRDRVWSVAEEGPGRMALVQEVAAGPYRYVARLVHEAAADGFGLDLTLTNRGEAAMPFGAGWHPWFVRTPHTRLSFRATHRCLHDARHLPISASASAGLDAQEAGLLGLDSHFAGWDGRARIARPGLAMEIRAGGALATNLQVYAPREPAVLCVEPSSHLPDVANRPGLAALGGMRLLAPGESLTGRITLVVDRSQQGIGQA